MGKCSRFLLDDGKDLSVDYSEWSSMDPLDLDLSDYYDLIWRQRGLEFYLDQGMRDEGMRRRRSGFEIV